MSYIYSNAKLHLHFVHFHTFWDSSVLSVAFAGFAAPYSHTNDMCFMRLTDDAILWQRRDVMGVLPAIFVHRNHGC